MAVAGFVVINPCFRAALRALLIALTAKLQVLGAKPDSLSLVR